MIKERLNLLLFRTRRFGAVAVVLVAVVVVLPGSRSGLEGEWLVRIQTSLPLVIVSRRSPKAKFLSALGVTLKVACVPTGLRMSFSQS